MVSRPEYVYTAIMEAVVRFAAGRVMSGCSPRGGGGLDLMAQLYDPRFRAVDKQDLPVAKSAVSDSLGAVPGHDQLDRSRLGMPR